MADELKTLPMDEGLAAARQTTGTALVDVREAGEKLVSFGYSDVTNIGGILDYTGQIEK